MHVVDCELLECGSFLQDLCTLVVKFIILSLGCRGTVEVVSTKDGGIRPLLHGPGVKGLLLGMEVHHREDLQRTGISEDATAFGQSLVKLGILYTRRSDR